MARSSRLPSHLVNTLCSAPTKMHFFQLMRLLANQFASLRIKSNLSLSFTPSAITSIRINDTESDNNSIEVLISFLGLTGQSAILPDHFTELLLERAQVKDYVMRDFFDIFNQRMAKLYYQFWRQARYFIAYEQDQNWLEQDLSLSFVAALTGKSTKQPIAEEAAWQPDALIYYAGLLANQVHSRVVLEAVLTDYFSLPILVQSFAGEWLSLTQDAMTCLGVKGAYQQLGKNALLGRRVWLVQNRFVVQISVNSYQKFSRLMPCYQDLLLMHQIIGHYVGMEFSFAIKIKINPEAIKHCQLRNQDPFYLGWNSWLKASVANQNQHTIAFNQIKGKNHVRY